MMDESEGTSPRDKIQTLPKMKSSEIRSRAQPEAAHTPTDTLLRYCYAEGGRRVYVTAHSETAAQAVLRLAVRSRYPKEPDDYWQAFDYNGNEIVYWSSCEACMIDDAGHHWGCALVLCLGISCEISANSREEVVREADSLCARLNAGIDAQFALARLHAENAALIEALERLLAYTDGFTQHCASKPDAKTHARAALAKSNA